MDLPWAKRGNGSGCALASSQWRLPPLLVLFAIITLSSVLLLSCTQNPPTPTANSGSTPIVVTATPGVISPEAGVTAVSQVILISPTPVLSPTPEVSPIPTVTNTPTPAPSATSSPTPSTTPAPVVAKSYLDDSTLLTMYGRAFGVAPILGRLGSYQNFNDMAEDVKQFEGQVKANNGGKKVVPTLHLIYGMAMPCVPKDDCLLYLEGTEPDIIGKYIKPAAERGWLVILDTQMGRSDPMTQVKRMIAKGYLDYDNVHVALDPEFSSVAGHDTPGIPIGTLSARDINDVQKLLDEHVKAKKLPHRKILMIHQFGDPQVNDGVPNMISDKTTIKTFENVDFVIDADGFGGSDSKITKYNQMTDTTAYPFIKYRAIKLFLPNPHEQAHHYDKPQMTWEQTFGNAETPGGSKMKHKPDIVILA